MSLPRLLIPFALSLMLLACGDQAALAEVVTPSAAPVATTSAAPAPPAATEPEPEPESAPTPSAPLPQAAPRPRPAEIQGLVLGQDYDIIEGGQRFTQDDNVEVVEVFAYWCGGCAHFAPLIEGWKSTLPASVQFVYVPLVGNPQDAYPRAFYAAEAVGILDQVHSATFQAIHASRSLRPNSSPDDIADFFATQNGITSAQAIKSTMASFSVNVNLGRARQFAIRNGVSHTPMLIIDGQYRVNGKNHQDQLRIANLILAHLTRPSS